MCIGVDSVDVGLLILLEVHLQQLGHKLTSRDVDDFIERDQESLRLLKAYIVGI